MREITIEKFLIDEVERRGGEVVKMGLNGWPDRVVILPGPRIGWLELKRPGEVPSVLQASRLARLTALGALAMFADSFNGVQRFLVCLTGLEPGADPREVCLSDPDFRVLTRVDVAREAQEASAAAEKALKKAAGA